MMHALELFSLDLDEQPYVETNLSLILPDTKKFTGSFCILNLDIKRCSRCGMHVDFENSICPQCIGAVFCSCHNCQQIASIVRAITWELRKGKYEFYEREHMAFLKAQLKTWESKPCPIQGGSNVPF